eukprot:1460231-Pyramimonas_sp.AAC.1
MWCMLCGATSIVQAMWCKLYDATYGVPVTWCELTEQGRECTSRRSSGEPSSTGKKKVGRATSVYHLRPSGWWV